jgi:predicted dehydrogenase
MATDNRAGEKRLRLRLGMVGGGQCAFIGAVHRMAARLDDRWELVAGALSSDPKNAHQSAASLGIPSDRSYTDFRKMAQAEAARPDGIDAVSIVTPNHLHHAMCVPFLEAGIHVICDKPMTTTLAEAEDLVRRVKETGLVFVVTQNNTGYPMVRHAREMVKNAELGKLRIVQVSYAQEFLTTLIESTGLKQATWRTDPAQAGATATLGDIGVHAFNLASFITGLELEAVAADLQTFVSGRRLDDNAHVLLRYANGVRGMLWASQTAPGNNNRLKIEVYGEKGSVMWCGETPDELRVAQYGIPPQLVVRGGPGANPISLLATRMPPGHPEGYVEGFGILYRDTAEAIAARLEHRKPDPQVELLPGVEAGAEGVAFIHAVLASSQHEGRWTRLR